MEKVKGEVKFNDIDKKGNFTKVMLSGIDKKIIIDNKNDEVYVNVNDISLFTSFGITPIYEIVQKIKKRSKN